MSKPESQFDAFLADFIRKLGKETKARGVSKVATELGVSRDTIQDWIAKRTQPRLDKVFAAIDAYGFVVEGGGKVFGTRTQITPRFDQLA